MMHVMQAVTDQIQGAVTDTDWSEDEDPEHHIIERFLKRDGSDQVDEEPSDDAAQENMDVFLDSAEFREVLEDRGFRADLKWACQFTFNRFSQSTHSTWEDLQQEVLIRFGRWLPVYKKKAKRKTVLVRIAVNVLIDANRAERSIRRQHEQVNFEDLAWEPSHGEPKREIESRIFLDECRRNLSRQELAVFDEHAVYGESLRQLALKHGVSATTMSKWWAQIITKLHVK